MTFVSAFVLPAILCIVFVIVSSIFRAKAQAYDRFNISPTSGSVFSKPSVIR